MTGEEIREKILFNKQRIEQLFDPGIFVLQEEATKLIEENEHLQSICNHQYENGVCIYCGKEEK